MFENITNFFKKVTIKQLGGVNKAEAKERLHLVLLQDRANVSADFLDMMKQEIIEVIKKYIDVNEDEIDVKLTNKQNSDGTTGAPALYANIPIVGIKSETRKLSNKLNLEKMDENNKKQNNKEKQRKNNEDKDLEKNNKERENEKEYETKLDVNNTSNKEEKKQEKEIEVKADVNNTNNKEGEKQENIDNTKSKEEVSVKSEERSETKDLNIKTDKVENKNKNNYKKNKNKNKNKKIKSKK